LRVRAGFCGKEERKGPAIVDSTDEMQALMVVLELLLDERQLHELLAVSGTGVNVTRANAGDLLDPELIPQLDASVIASVDEDWRRLVVDSQVDAAPVGLKRILDALCDSPRSLLCC